jgi:hypothetical protein
LKKFLFLVTAAILNGGRGELQAQLQKEAETQPTTDNKPFEMPCDSNLFKYLEENRAKSKIM